MPKKATTFCMPESHCNHKYMYLDRPSTSKNAAILGLSPIYNKHIKQKKPHTHNCIFVEQTIYLSGFPRPICGNMWQPSLRFPQKQCLRMLFGISAIAARAVENPSGWFLQHMKSHESCGPNGINKTDGASLWSFLGILAIEDGWFLHSLHQIDYRKRLRYADLATPAKSGLIRLILSLDVVGTTQWDSIEGVTIHKPSSQRTCVQKDSFKQKLGLRAFKYYQENIAMQPSKEMRKYAFIVQSSTSYRGDSTNPKVTVLTGDTPRK